MILITAISKYVINYNYIIVCPKPSWVGLMNMAERPREVGNFMGWVSLRLNFRSKGYVLRQYLWTG